MGLQCMVCLSGCFKRSPCCKIVPEVDFRTGSRLAISLFMCQIVSNFSHLSSFPEEELHFEINLLFSVKETIR